MRRLGNIRSILVVATLFAIPPLAAQDGPAATVVPIQVTGDPAARFSLVILGDGYTAAEMPKFRAHVDKHLNVLWSIEPFRSYRNYINVYAVEVASPESGITCDPEVRLQRNTVFRMAFDDGCSNRNARGITVPQERQGLVRQYASKATPNFDQILVIANTDTYGGIGGGLATTSGGNSLGPLITPHELGHSLGRLTDEYTYSARGRPGPPYAGGEPNSPHMTVMSIEDMLTKQAKWFRWLGEPSESGGKIERYEGGSQRLTGIFRPSRHSMMISVGYYFDQVSREQMTRRISEQVQLIAASTPTDALVGRTDVLWIETPQPVYHELTATWSIDGQAVTTMPNARYFDLGTVKPAADAKTVTVTVVDPTPFVRDPEIRKTALTATRSWKLDATPHTPQASKPPSFTSSTQTSRPVGGKDVVYVVTSNLSERIADVTWRLNGEFLAASTANGRVFSLAALTLAPGRHTLTATVSDPRAPGGPTGADATRTWTVDNTEPTVKSTFSAAALVWVPSVDAGGHYLVRDEFTLKLEPADDQPGYVVAEFRVNGDGWHHYYGWPDAPPGTPFKFTPSGTTIKELVYGSLASEGLSPQPWEPREPGWGTHRIEYRGIDAAGNIGTAKAFRVTLLETPECTTTIIEPQAGELRVTTGVTCVNGATISGPVTVSAGASFIATNAKITGALTATGAARIELIRSTLDGDVRLTGTTGSATVFGSTIGRGLFVSNNRTAKAILIAGNTVRDGIACTGNTIAPINGGTPNSREGTGQCAR